MWSNFPREGVPEDMQRISEERLFASNGAPEKTNKQKFETGCPSKLYETSRGYSCKEHGCRHKSNRDVFAWTCVTNVTSVIFSLASHFSYCREARKVTKSNSLENILYPFL